MQALHEHIAKDGFRLRGTSMSRIEGFSDVVFGFALTLIVVSIEVPRTYDQLHAVLADFLPFAICFVLFLTVWWSHYQFFRRFGLEDVRTVIINCALLFTVLFYVFPLKFLFTVFANQITGHANSHAFSDDPLTAGLQSRELFMVYGAGYAAIHLLYAALNANAWRQRLHLRLSPLENTLTLSYIGRNLGLAVVGIVCVVTARLLPPMSSGNAGFCFFLIPIWETLFGYVAGRKIRAAHAHRNPEDRAALPHPT